MVSILKTITADSFSIYHFPFFIFHFVLCAASEISVTLWWAFSEDFHHRGTEGTKICTEKEMGNQKWKMIYGK